jgi:tRNA nucleotidyltransferase (CCA-adding enzyme)
MGVFRSLGWGIRITKRMGTTFGSLADALAWFHLQFWKENIEPWKLYFLAFFYRLERKKALKICKRLRMERRAVQLLEETYRYIPKIVRSLSAPDVSRSRIYFNLCEISLEVLLFTMARVENEEVQKSISVYLNHLRSINIDIKGKDLKDMGILPGPVYRDIMRYVKAFVLDTGNRDYNMQKKTAQDYYRRLQKK